MLLVSTVGSIGSRLAFAGKRFLRLEHKTSNRFKKMIFRQLFEKESSTYTYLLADEKTKQACLIDPVLETAERDAQLVKELGLELLYGINTHVHADHITGTGVLKTKFFPKMKSVLGEEGNEKAKADIFVKEGETIKVGDITINVLSTPGHTNGCHSYYVECDDRKMVFTGDAVLIRGCGRTDFQEGSAATLYESIQKKIFTLDDGTEVWPAHDYKGNTVSTVGEEKKFNPRLTKSKEEFIDIMDNLGLPYPKKIDASLPANLVCGLHEI